MADEDADWARALGGDPSNVGGVIPSLDGADAIKHAADAIDFEDEDELADDELPEEEEATGNNVIEEDEEMIEEEAGLSMSGNDSMGGFQFNIGEDELGGFDLGDDDHWSQSWGGNEMEEMPVMDEYDDGGVVHAGTLNNNAHNNNHVVHAGEPEESEEEMDLEAAGGDGLDMKLDADELGELGKLGPADKMDASGFDDISHMNIQELNLEEIAQMARQADLDMLGMYFPGFQKGKPMKMNSLFYNKFAVLSLPKPNNARPCVPTKTKLEVAPDERKMTRGTVWVDNAKRRAGVVTVTEVETGDDNQDQTGESRSTESATDQQLHFDITDWKITWGDEEDGDGDVDMDREDKKIKEEKEVVPQLGVHRNEEAWNDEALFEGDALSQVKKVNLDMNDPNLLFINTDGRVSRNVAPAIPSTELQLRNRFNLSNDRAYDMLKENTQSKVRATIGNLSIDHSMPALRLQSPFYKVRISKPQARSFHRPSFVVKPNTTVHFSRMKIRKKKRDKGKPIKDLLAKTTDLSLGDSAQYFLMEYAEQFPMTLSNYGMGSKMINYYRKASPEDTSRPKLPVGETHVLSVQDKSPFWNFGFVEPGKIVPTLYNKMIRAPVFKHTPRDTDFLMIRSTGGDVAGAGQKYFLRNIPHVFTVGQTYPVTDVPGPHSRKVTTASKNRLKMIVYRVLNASPYHRINVKDIAEHFPDQIDTQNRQRLKEFMEYQRTGEDQGYWKVKPTDTLPGEDGIRTMITPEDITLLEAMQVGVQNLEDAGYGRTDDIESDHENGEESGLSLEEQSAPWNLTRNFINATQGKAMLQLHGEGDPSGRGEGFSFLKTSMKGGFQAAGESVNEKLDKSKFGGHKYNVAHQQRAYDDEISRIWYAQCRALSNTKVPEESEEDSKWADAEEQREQRERVSTPGFSGAAFPDDDNMSLMSGDSAMQQRNKVLRITRMVKDEHGIIQRKVETIKDPSVIRAYIRRRKLMDEAKLTLDDLDPTNDEEANKRNKRLLEERLEDLRKKGERRKQRQAQKQGLNTINLGTDTPPPSGKGVGKGKGPRQCKNCGAYGHIRTNKSCPMYNQLEGPANL